MRSSSSYSKVCNNLLMKIIDKLSSAILHNYNLHTWLHPTYRNLAVFRDKFISFKANRTSYGFGEGISHHSVQCREGFFLMLRSVFV